MIEPIECQGDHFDRSRAGLLRRNRTIFGIEVTCFHVTLPPLKSFVSPWTFDVQKTFAVLLMRTSRQVFSRYPKQSVSRAAVGHLQRFEIERLRFGPLSQQFP